MLRMWAWQHSPQAQLVEELEVQAVRFGEVAIVALPVELFTAIGEEIKRASPFRDTFIATLANGWHGYVPTREAFARGGYEPRFAYPSRLVEEAGDLLSGAAMGLLRGMKDGG
jgi:neutral ceramidase